MPIWKSIKGFFGQTIHYKDGVKVGETWDGLIPGSKNHYDSNGGYVGTSTSGFIADQVHYNQYGVRIGESWADDFGTIRHYDANGRIGTSYDGFLGMTSQIMNDGDTLFDHSEDSNSFTDDAPYSDPDW